MRYKFTLSDSIGTLVSVDTTDRATTTEVLYWLESSPLAQVRCMVRELETAILEDEMHGLESFVLTLENVEGDE